MQELKQWNALGTNIIELRAKIKATRSHNRRLKQKLKELETSRNLWRDKYKDLKVSTTGVPKVTRSHQTQVKGYQYSLQVIQMSVYLYLVLGCGYRGIVKILLYIQLEFGIIDNVPAKSIIAVWVQKLGYYKYMHPEIELGKAYGLIIDECMVIGQQRLLLILGVEAQKHQQDFLTYQQVRILTISVKPSWKAKDIAEVIGKVTEKLGRKPSYIISDGNSNLLRGISDSASIRIADVSHQMALILDKYYRNNAEFIHWQKAIAEAKFKGIMRDIVYLLPPKQRVIARFMNLKASIVWSKHIIRCYKQLTVKDQDFFRLIKQHQKFIEQIQKTFELSEHIVDILKINGLSYQSIAKSEEQLNKYRSLIDVKIIKAIEDYLQSEKMKLPDENTVWHCCSNCIESLFADFKQKLPLPLKTDKGIRFDIKTALEQVSMSDLDQWTKAVLADSQVIRRRKMFQI